MARTFSKLSRAVWTVAALSLFAAAVQLLFMPLGNIRTARYARGRVEELRSDGCGPLADIITMSKSGLISPELQALGNKRRAFAGRGAC